MPNITYKSCYYLLILLHEKFYDVFILCRIFFPKPSFLTSCFSFKYFSAVGKLDVLGY